MKSRRLRELLDISSTWHFELPRLVRKGRARKHVSARAWRPLDSPAMRTTYGLVVLSALMHAYWNFLIKRSGGTVVFVGLSKIAEVVVFAPVFAIVLATRTGEG